MPEVFGDWDSNPDLDIQGHLENWWNVLYEMMVMVVMQFISNVVLLVPFFINGKYKDLKLCLMKNRFNKVMTKCPIKYNVFLNYCL